MTQLAQVTMLSGGVLMIDVNQNKVHIMYLSLLKDLAQACNYSWGSAVLACLYHKLCRAIKPSTKTMDGLPYTVVIGLIPDAIFGISEPSTAVLATLEWHATDRVFRQFSCMQPIPHPSQEFKEIHGIEKEDRDHINWVKKHAPYIILWNAWTYLATTSSLNIRHTLNRPHTTRSSIIFQYPFTHDDGVYDYTTFLSTLEVDLSNYQMPPQGAHPCRWRQPNHYTLASGTSPGS
ncbi:hypothetical protein PVK06_004498 [Gossypium arboreum]|uniref:Aminotransferase-like plant mobile domain-containing protein n=1 Tax=Gossypium arboreum TaxID=29729 RepID=A0ABR0QTF3_GOSAR|nr:hypothetical protein PVK06_004498 [Gossypium arboreum]